MTHSELMIDGVTKTTIYMALPSRTPIRDPSIRWHMNKKKSFRHGSDTTHVAVQFQFVVELPDRSASSDFSPFNVYIPVRNNVNNGSECAPLNFVMASAAFRLCGHHRGRHIALRINSSMIGTSRADFRSS